MSGGVTWPLITSRICLQNHSSTVRLLLRLLPRICVAMQVHVRILLELVELLLLVVVQDFAQLGVGPQMTNPLLAAALLI